MRTDVGTLDMSSYNPAVKDKTSSDQNGSIGCCKCEKTGHQLETVLFKRWNSPTAAEKSTKINRKKYWP